MRMRCAVGPRWPRHFLVVLGLSAGCGPVGGRLAGPPPDVKPFEIQSLLPQPEHFPDFKATAAPKLYTGKELAKFEPAESDLFHAYGFARLVTQTFLRERDGTPFTLAAYDMVRPINAFGIFSQRRDGAERAQRVEIGEEARLYRSTVEFYSGDYFVRVAAGTYSASNDVIAQNLAQEIADQVPESQGERVQARCAVLPNGALPGSTTYHLSGAFGHGFLADAIEAKYRVGRPRPCRLFYARLDSVQAATTAMTQLRGAYTSVKDLPPGRKLGEGAFEARDDFYGRIVLFQVGSYVGGMFHVGRRSKTDPLLQALHHSLRQQHARTRRKSG